MRRTAFVETAKPEAGGRLLTRAHRRLRGVEIEAQPRLWPVPQAHRAKVRGVSVDVVEGDVQRSRKLLRLKQLKGSGAGALKQLHNTVRRPLGNRLDVLMVERHPGRPFA